MEKFTFIHKCACLCIIMIVSFTSCEDYLGTDYVATGDIETDNSTDFIDGADGWMIEGDANKVEAEYSSTDGLDGSGYIFAKDQTTGGVWYYVAPSKFLGDKSKFHNGYLRFYLQQDSDFRNQFRREDIFIDGGDAGTLWFYFDSYPSTTWTKYEIRLNDSAPWLDDKDGNLASDTHIKNVLSQITKLRIRGEFESGPDTGGLDSFSFSKK